MRFKCQRSASILPCHRTFEDQCVFGVYITVGMQAACIAPIAFTVLSQLTYQTLRPGRITSSQQSLMEARVGGLPANYVFR